MPYALWAPNVSTAAQALAIGNAAVGPASLDTPAPPAAGQVLSYDGTELMWATLGNSGVGGGWGLTGNGGTVAGVNFLGTTNAQPLELRTFNQRGLRLEPGLGNSVDVIGGWRGNEVAAGVGGVTIAGGGMGNWGGSVHGNRVEANFGTIGGGANNAVTMHPVQPGAQFRRA